MEQGDLAARCSTLRMRTQRLCSPSVPRDLWDTTAYVSRATLTRPTLPPLLPPPGRRRGVTWLSTSRLRSPRRARPVLTLSSTAPIRWEILPGPFKCRHFVINTLTQWVADDSRAHQLNTGGGSFETDIISLEQLACKLSECNGCWRDAC